MRGTRLRHLLMVSVIALATHGMLIAVSSVEAWGMTEVLDDRWSRMHFESWDRQMTAYDSPAESFSDCTDLSLESLIFRGPVREIKLEMAVFTKRGADTIEEREPAGRTLFDRQGRIIDAEIPHLGNALIDHDAGTSRATVMAFSDDWVLQTLIKTDGTGRVLKDIQYEHGSVKKSISHIYDAQGRAVENDFFDGRGTPLARVLVSYDKQGTLIERTVRLADGTLVISNSNGHTPLGTESHEEIFSKTDSGILPESRTTEAISMTAFWRESVHFDGRGRFFWREVVSNDFAHGVLVTIRETATFEPSIEVRYTDLSGHVLEEDTFNAGGMATVRSTYKYNSQGLVAVRKDYASDRTPRSQRTFSYDSFGNKTVTDLGGAVLQRTDADYWTMDYYE